MMPNMSASSSATSSAKNETSISQGPVTHGAVNIDFGKKTATGNLVLYGGIALAVVVVAFLFFRRK